MSDIHPTTSAADTPPAPKRRRPPTTADRLQAFVELPEQFRRQGYQTFIQERERNSYPSTSRGTAAFLHALEMDGRLTETELLFYYVCALTVPDRAP